MYPNNNSIQRNKNKSISEYLAGEASLEAYGLQSLQGSQGEVNVNEDMQEVCKGYKLGNDIPFTATYKGKFDAAVQAASEEGNDTAAMEDVVVDVEAVAE